MQKHVNLVDLVKSFPTNIFLQNLASIQQRTSLIKFDHLAEKSEQGSISNLSTKVPRPARDLRLPQAERRPAGAARPLPLARARRRGSVITLARARRRQRASVGKISAKYCSFSAVSAPIFARKYTFCSIFQNLQDSQAEIFEI